IVIVAPPGWEEPSILLAEELACTKVVACATGGETRAESVRGGVAEVGDDAAVIVVHDAARPVLPDEVLERVLTALNEGWDGAVPVLPLADTVKRVRDGRIDHTVAAVERYVEAAADRGVDEIGFTEHVYYFEQTRHLWDEESMLERCVYDLDRYVGAVVEAKERGLPVKLGLEVDYVAG